MAAPRPPVPLAHTLPPGAVVLSLRGTERDDLTGSIVIYGVGIFALGVLAGYLLTRS